MLRFFRGGFRCAGELVSALHDGAARYVSDVRKLWDMTAAELDAQIRAGRERDAARAAENERLAFNIGALVLAAFNTPRKFPRTPDAAFGRRTAPPDGGKSDLMLIARQLNGRLRRQTGEHE